MATFNINKDQLNAIVEALDRTDYVEILLTQLFTLIVAIGSSWFIQSLFRKADDRARMIKEAHQFNEGVIYMSSLVEASTTYIASLILPNIASQTQILNEISSNVHQGVLRIQTPLQSIRPFDPISQNNFVPKIPNIGEHIEILKVFYSLIEQVEQARAIAEDRHIMIGNFLQFKGLRSTEDISDRLSEIQQRTLGMLLSMEYILDASLYISTELTKVSKNIRVSLQTNKIKGIGVSETMYNKKIDEIRLEARKIIDSIPEWANRVLHMPPNFYGTAVE